MVAGQSFLRSLDKKLWKSAGKLRSNLDDKMTTLTSELADQFAQSATLEKVIRKNMESLGFELPAGGEK